MFIRWCNIICNDVFRHYQRKETKPIQYMKKKHVHLWRRPTVAIVPWMAVRRGWSHNRRFLRSTVNHCERFIWIRRAQKSNKRAVMHNGVKLSPARKVNNNFSNYLIIIKTCIVILYRSMSTNMLTISRQNDFVRHRRSFSRTCRIRPNTPLICYDYCIRWSNTKQRLFSNTSFDDTAMSSTIIFIRPLAALTSNWKPTSCCRISNPIAFTTFSRPRTAPISIRWPPVYAIEKTIPWSIRFSDRILWNINRQKWSRCWNATWRVDWMSSLTGKSSLLDLTDEYTDLWMTLFRPNLSNHCMIQILLCNEHFLKMIFFPPSSQSSSKYSECSLFISEWRSVDDQQTWKISEVDCRQRQIGSLDEPFVQRVLRFHWAVHDHPQVRPNGTLYQFSLCKLALDAVND